MPTFRFTRSNWPTEYGAPRVAVAVLQSAIRCTAAKPCSHQNPTSFWWRTANKNARTTPAVRAEIAASSQTASVLAQRYGITEQTVYKWKKREVFGDRCHTAHRLKTVLTPAQETVVVHLRRTLPLPLDDLLAVTREFLCPDVSRSGLDRCRRRHGVGTLHALKPREPKRRHAKTRTRHPQPTISLISCAPTTCPSLQPTGCFSISGWWAARRSRRRTYSRWGWLPSSGEQLPTNLMARETSRPAAQQTVCSLRASSGLCRTSSPILNGRAGPTTRAPRLSPRKALSVPRGLRDNAASFRPRRSTNRTTKAANPFAGELQKPAACRWASPASTRPGKIPKAKRSSGCRCSR